MGAGRFSGSGGHAPGVDESDGHRRLHVPDDELARRRAAWQPPARVFRRGYGRLFIEHVNQAPLGCDFDFLLGSDPVHATEQSKF